MPHQDNGRASLPLCVLDKSDGCSRAVFLRHASIWRGLGGKGCSIERTPVVGGRNLGIPSCARKIEGASHIAARFKEWDQLVPSCRAVPCTVNKYKSRSDTRHSHYFYQLEHKNSFSRSGRGLRRPLRTV